MTNMRHDSTHWLARYRAAVAPVRARAAAAYPTVDIPVSTWLALLDCFDAGRPFSMLRTVDNVERVRMRDAWEGHRRTWRADAMARYADIRHAALGQHVDTTG